ncbi:hypothetical protein [Chakrabartyella piscis]|nr:hypothetical protein [Chakrabartyella piscis]
MREMVLNKVYVQLFTAKEVADTVGGFACKVMTIQRVVEFEVKPQGLIF